MWGQLVLVFVGFYPSADPDAGAESLVEHALLEVVPGVWLELAWAGDAFVLVLFASGAVPSASEQHLRHRRSR